MLHLRSSPRSAIARFSRTLSEANTRRPCGTSDTPARAIRWAGQRATSLPPSSTRPWRAGVKPMMLRMSVVLPTPLRPKTATSPPAGNVSDTPCST